MIKVLTRLISYSTKRRHIQGVHANNTSSDFALEVSVSLFNTTFISVYLARYEICRAKVCDVLQGCYKAISVLSIAYLKVGFFSFDCVIILLIYFINCQRALFTKK